MAYVTHATAPSFLSRIGDAVEGVVTRYRKYRVYRETLDGLSALTNRELTDLGLHRAELRAVARDAAGY